MIGKIIDDAISLLSPSWALKRSIDRIEYEKIRGYSGAKTTKSDPYWQPKNNSADSEIICDLPKLRARSRDLVRNNPWANSIVEAFIKNVIGAKGIRPQIKSHNPEKIEKYIREAFKSIDVTGKMPFLGSAGLQGLVMRHVLVDGECFVRIIQSRKKLYLQVIEPDQIWSSNTESLTGNEIRTGIEIDKHTGRHLSYRINYHPGDYSLTTRLEEIVVPAEDMIHVFVRTRANQTRGVPIFAPIINVLKDRGEYLYTEMVAARVAACLSVLIRKNVHSDPTQNDSGDKITSLSPGMVARLKPGEDVSIIEPRRPGSNFVPFNQTMDRAAAAGTGLSYATVSKDYSQTNFSGERTSLIGEYATYEGWQSLMETELCERVLNAVLDFRFLQGSPEMPADIERIWQGEGFDWVDPMKDVKASILAIKNNLETKASVIARRGGDINEVYEQRAKEIELEKKMGIYNEPTADDRFTESDNDNSAGSESASDDVAADVASV